MGRLDTLKLRVASIGSIEVVFVINCIKGCLNLTFFPRNLFYSGSRLGFM